MIVNESLSESNKNKEDLITVRQEQQRIVSRLNEETEASKKEQIKTQQQIELIISDVEDLENSHYELKYEYESAHIQNGSSFVDREQVCNSISQNQETHMPYDTSENMETMREKFNLLFKSLDEDF